MVNLKENLEIIKAFQVDFDDIIEMLDRESKIITNINSTDLSQVSLLLRNAISSVKNAKLYTQYAEEHLKHKL